MEYFSVGRWFREKAKEAGVPIDEFVKNCPEDMHREIDSHMKKIAKEKNVVLDARLAGWMVPDADLKIFLTAPFETRVGRIAESHKDRIAEAREGNETWTDEVSRREKEEIEKYKELYGIDLEDLSIYDLVLNTGKISAEDVLEIVEVIIKKVVKH